MQKINIFYTKLEELMERGTEERESIEAVAFLLFFLIVIPYTCEH